MRSRFCRNRGPRRKKARENPPGLAFFLRSRARRQVRVRIRIMKLSNLEFRHLHPCQRFVAVGRQAGVHLAEMRVGLRQVRIDFVGGAVAGLQYFLRKGTQERAGHQQPPQRRRVDVVVLPGHPRIGIMRGRGDRRLVVLRQRIPSLDVDDVVSLAGALPPARIVVILRDLHETELLVVIRADPFGRIDRALFECGIDIASRDLLRYATDLRDDGPGKTTNAEFEPL